MCRPSGYTKSCNLPLCVPPRRRCCATHLLEGSKQQTLASFRLSVTPPITFLALIMFPCPLFIFHLLISFLLHFSVHVLPILPSSSFSLHFFTSLTFLFYLCSALLLLFFHVFVSRTLPFHLFSALVHSLPYLLCTLFLYSLYLFFLLLLFTFFSSAFFLYSFYISLSTTRFLYSSCGPLFFCLLSLAFRSLLTDHFDCAGKGKKGN